MAFFNGATRADIPSGTLMLFQQTAAPTGWTKETTHDNKALRVVSGTAGSGGTTAFTSVFTNQTPTITTSGLSAGATTLSTTQIPSHNHQHGIGLLNDAAGAFGSVNAGTSTVYFYSDFLGSTTAGASYRANTSSTGSGGSHTHSIAGSATSSAITLNVQYVDLIIASKN